MENIKQIIDSETGKLILTIIIIILVGTGSFELGRLSKSGESSGIKIIEPPEMPQSANTANFTSGQINSAQNSQKINFSTNTQNKIATPVAKNYFASKRGSKYYPIGCSAGKTIKQENRVYFATPEDAQKAGFELSSSCK